MSKLQEVAKAEASKTLTENGAVAYNTTFNACVDLFSMIGAMRSRDPEDIVEKFSAAFDEDPLLATKMMFYCGDIRQGGLGERDTFRICLDWMARNHSDIVIKNIGLIPYYNRWDSIYVLFSTPCESEAIELIRAQLAEDLQAMIDKKPISLLAKWLKSENASSKETKSLARSTRTALGLTARQYRKMLSEMRAYLKIVERLMSNGQWEDVDYAAVPSYAMNRYRNAFQTHDSERFAEYIQALKDGKTKINASVLFPYDLVGKYLYHNCYGMIKGADDIVEEQWKALPNYVKNESNILVMADVSGSMWVRPMETSIGLAIYFAERNEGPLKNVYMTFTSDPHFQYISGIDTLYGKVKKVLGTDIGYSTDLKRAFDYLLDQAVHNWFSQKDMPAAICVISDMEINPYFSQAMFGAYSNWNLDFLKTVKADYAAAGFECPKLILWNVESRHDIFLSQNEDVIFVSGQSPSTFRHLTAALDGKTGYDFMVEVLNSEAYDKVTI